MLSGEKGTNYYNEKYFAWQKGIGAFGGWAAKSIFSPFISLDDIVLDFGCGGGFLLKNIECKKKIGIEINSTAAEMAAENGLEVHSFLDNIPDDYVDVIVSNNALEHTHYPLDELKKLYAKLKRNGKIIFIVPCENINYDWKPNDINQHLYSWSPMCIGNLFTLAGFSVIESKSYIHKWPPKYEKIARIGGRKIFDIASRIYGQLKREWFQVKIIAEKL
jgi:SAM-dependent methyltransferase